MRSGSPAPEEGLAREFGLLEEMVRTIHEAAEILLSGLEKRISLPRAWAEIRDLEHKGDAIARDLFDALLAPRPSAVD